MGFISRARIVKSQIDHTRNMIDIARKDRDERKARELKKELEIQKLKLANAKEREKLEAVREETRRRNDRAREKKYKGSLIYKGIKTAAKYTSGKKTSSRKTTKRRTTRKASRRR